VPAGTPVKEALELAVKQALQARKGALLPALLLPGAASCSSSEWAAAGCSRLVAALSAAEINMNLRAKVRGNGNGAATIGLQTACCCVGRHASGCELPGAQIPHASSMLCETTATAEIC
jgi:hypothetical protein